MKSIFNRKTTKINGKRRSKGVKSLKLNRRASYKTDGSEEEELTDQGKNEDDNIAVQRYLKEKKGADDDEIQEKSKRIL